MFSCDKSAVSLAGWNVFGVNSVEFNDPAQRILLSKCGCPLDDLDQRTKFATCRTKSVQRTQLAKVGSRLAQCTQFAKCGGLLVQRHEAAHCDGELAQRNTFAHCGALLAQRACHLCARDHWGGITEWESCVRGAQGMGIGK